MAAASLLGVACSDDSDEPAVVQRRTPDDGATTTVAESPVSTTEAEGTGEDGGGDGSSGSGGDTDSGSSPQDQTLDIELRHPEGLTVTVSGLRFEDRAIYVDAEMVNGSNVEGVTLTSGRPSMRLRLIDDAGVEYPYVPAEEDDGDVALDPGESVSGGFAFRGPLSGRPDRLLLVANLRTEEVAGFDINEDTGGIDRLYPSFVVPFDLEWS